MLIPLWTQEAQAHNARSYHYFSYLYANVQRNVTYIYRQWLLLLGMVTRSMTFVWQHIVVLCYNGVNLKVCMGTNGNGHYSWSFDILKKKIRLVLMPCCLFYCHVASQLDPKPFKRVASLVFLCFFRFSLLSRDTTTQVKHNLSYPSFLTLNSYDFYFWWRTQSDCKPAIDFLSWIPRYSEYGIELLLTSTKHFVYFLGRSSSWHTDWDTKQHGRICEISLLVFL